MTGTGLPAKLGYRDQACSVLLLRHCGAAPVLTEVPVPACPAVTGSQAHLRSSCCPSSLQLPRCPAPHADIRHSISGKSGQVGSSTRGTVGSRPFIATTNKRGVALVWPPLISSFLKTNRKSGLLPRAWTTKKTAGRRSPLDISLDHVSVMAACFKGITLELLSCRRPRQLRGIVTEQLQRFVFLQNFSGSFLHRDVLFYCF